MCENNKWWANFGRFFSIATGLFGLLFALATGIVMLSKKSEVDLWIILVVCVAIFLIAAVCYTIIECKLLLLKEKELQKI